MTPKEKAKELIINYKNILPRMDYRVLQETAEQCALICADEVINSATEVFNEYAIGFNVENWKVYKYWQDVKKEILNQ